MPDPLAWRHGEHTMGKANSLFTTFALHGLGPPRAAIPSFCFPIRLWYSTRWGWAATWGLTDLSSLSLFPVCPASLSFLTVQAPTLKEIRRLDPASTGLWEEREKLRERRPADSVSTWHGRTGTEMVGHEACAKDCVRGILTK